ncbi:Conserved_hypothetical protein [Hexamita inflata]|uniref:Lipid-binding serum glycoprotein N-terminal domain-containing protein n=1 Tax=Hexamita inflata TaxID=28002 RepID=A0AA86VGL9_9EUKA|nr:Conserved hypothetical protein [Hexamita inflata]
MIVTQQGFNQFVLKYLKDCGKIIGRSFPDQIFSVNLGVTSLDLQLTDIFVSEFDVKQAYVMMEQDQKLSINIINASLAFDLQWKFQQTSYPYIHDQGEGKIIIKEVSFHLTLSTKCTYDDCPNRIVSDVENVQIEIDVISIQLSGGQSWIYQSMIDLVINAVKETLVASISQFIKETLVYELNSIFIYYRPTQAYADYPDVIKDERQVTGWYVQKGYGALMYSGYIYNANNYSDEFILSSMVRPILLNRFNNHMQVTIQSAAFNNLYYIFHKYYDSYSTPDYKVISPPVIQFFNVQALLTLQLSASDNIYTIKFLAQPTATFEKNLNCFYFNLLIHEMQPFNEELQLKITNQMNEMMRKNCYLFMNTPFSDVSKFEHVFIPEENAIRYLKYFD